MHVYRVSSVDDWAGWSQFKLDGPNPTPAYVLEVLATARQVAGLNFWDGDIREGPFRVPLPVPADGRGGDPRCIVAWKQDREDEHWDHSCLTIIGIAGPVAVVEEGRPSFRLHTMVAVIQPQ